MNKNYISKTMIYLTIVISVLVVEASVFGLASSAPYMLETQNWLLQARGQDIGNLIAVGTLLTCTYMAVKGSKRAYLVWLGTLFYLLYAYIIYAVAVHFNSLFLMYVAVLGLVFYTLVIALSKQSGAIVIKSVPKWSSYILLAVGLLFAFLWLSELVPSLISGVVPQSIREAGLWVNPIHVLDLSIVLPGFIVTAYLALKGKSTGMYFIAPWLAFSVLMGTSIVAAMILMLANGFGSAVAPMMMVAVVVVASFIALVGSLKGVK